MCREGFGDFFIHQALVHRVFEVKKNNSESYAKLAQVLKTTDYDICFCPHQSFRTARLVAQLHAKVKIGFKRWWNFFVFHQRVKRDLALPDALRQLSLLGAIDSGMQSEIAAYKRDFSWDVPAAFSMKLELKESALEPSLQKLGETPLILLAPGSQWPTKRWTVQGFIDVIKYLQSQNFVVALIGSGRDDESINAKIQEAVPASINLSGRTNLNELAWLMAQAQALICNDSGLMHLAATAGLPTVGIFGPTVLEFGYRPWQSQSTVVQKELFCRPCGKHGHRQCPLRTHECMKGIPSVAVLDGLRKVYKDLHQRELP